MLRDKKILRIFFIVACLAISFHMLGAEEAFCNDAPFQANSSVEHGCAICQPSGHVATISEQNLNPINMPTHYFFMEIDLIHTQDPISSILRPPLSA